METLRGLYRLPNGQGALFRSMLPLAGRTGSLEHRCVCVCACMCPTPNQLTPSSAHHHMIHSEEDEDDEEEEEEDEITHHHPSIHSFIHHHHLSFIESLLEAKRNSLSLSLSLSLLLVSCLFQKTLYVADLAPFLSLSLFCHIQRFIGTPAEGKVWAKTGTLI